MLFKLGKTSHLVSTWTKETFWRLAVTLLPLLVFSCVLGHPSEHIIFKYMKLLMYESLNSQAQRLVRHTYSHQFSQANHKPTTDHCINTSRSRVCGRVPSKREKHYMGGCTELNVRSRLQ